MRKYLVSWLPGALLLLIVAAWALHLPKQNNGLLGAVAISAAIVAFGLGLLIQMSWDFLSLKGVLKKARGLLSEANLQGRWDIVADQMQDLLEGTFAHEWRAYTRSVFFEEQGNSSSEQKQLFSLKAPAEFFNEETVLMRQVNMDGYQAIPGILTGLGLLFTFIGLTIGIHTGQLALDDMAKFQDSMKGLLGGASLAFVSSIAGLAMSLIFLAVLKWHRQEIYREILAFNVQLDDVVPTKQQVDLMHENNRIALEDRRILREMTSEWYLKFQDMFDNYLVNQQAFSKELTERIVEKIGSIDDSIKLMSEHQADQIGTMVSHSVDSFAQALSEEMGRMNDTFDASAKSIKHGAESLDGVMNRMVATSEAVTQTINTEISHMQSAIEAMTERFVQTGDEVNTFSETVKTSGEDFCASIGRAVSESDKLRESTQQAGESFEASIGKAGETFRQVTEDTSSAWGEEVNQTGQQFKQHVVTAGETFTSKLEPVLTQMQSAVENTHKQTEQFNALFDKHQTALTDINKAVEQFSAVQDQFSSFSTALEAVVERIETGESSVLEATRTLLVRQKDAHQLAQKHMVETTEDIKKRFEDLMLMQNGLEESFKGLHETMAANVKDLGESLQKLNGSLRDNLTTMDTEFSNALDILSQTVDKLEKTQDSFNSSLENSVRSAVKNFEAVKKTVDEKQDRAPLNGAH